MDPDQPTKMEKRRKKRLRVTFHRKMEERKLYMEELHEIREQNYKEKYTTIKRTIGPSWYQVLSHKQQKILQTVEASIYHDLLEGHPRRLYMILTALGIYPMPNKMDLLTCMYLGREDPKLFFAQLYYFLFDHDFSEKRNFSYNLNGRIILTSIYYLGLENLMELLKEKFAPTAVTAAIPGRQRLPPKNRNLSPYLQEFKLVTYEPSQPKQRHPEPLPDLDHLNAPYEKEIPRPKPPPPPPPPPPPKKRLPQAFCEKMAGYIQIGPAVKLELEPLPPKPASKRMRASKMKLTDGKKKVYGLAAIGFARRKPKPKKPRLLEMPNHSSNNYFITGVYVVGNRPCYVLGGICANPASGDIIHGGHKYVNGEYIRLHFGVVDHPPPERPDPCNCLEEWQDKMIKYVDSTKCRCGHFYDFGHEGPYPTNEPYLFEKPGKSVPGVFDISAIYEMEPRVGHIIKEYEKVWDDESMLQDDDENSETKKRKKAKKERELVKVPSNCLGPKPKIGDYLRCALRFLRRTNIAAQLPDIHKAPELREWMRKRIYGDYTREQKQKYLRKSQDYWQYLKTFQDMGLGKNWPEKNDLYQDFRKMSTWKHKTALQEKFKVYIEDYKAKMYKAHATFNNLFWATMFHPKFPDKRFREIFFCYLASKVSDLSLVHPYSAIETEKRTREVSEKRIVCYAKGVQDVDLGWK